LSQGKPRQGFVKLHEVGHDVLPWQKNIHIVLEDDDKSLSTETTDDFEAEANFFASATLFQHDRFVTELDKLGLAIESPMHLSKLFGASVHASLRRYVECSKNKCALIVLQNRSGIGLNAMCDVRDKFQSEKFSKSFGEIKIPLQLGISWSFVQDYHSNRKLKKMVT
jgi:hypothetical protein